MSTPLFFCITHKQPEWPLPEFLTIIGSGGFVPERGVAISERYPDIAFQNEHLGEFAAMLGLRRRLADAPQNSRFGICHYRRFALIEPLGELRGFNSYAHPEPAHRAHRARGPAKTQRRFCRRTFLFDAAATASRPVRLGQGHHDADDHINGRRGAPNPPSTLINGFP